MRNSELRVACASMQSNQDFNWLHQQPMSPEKLIQRKWEDALTRPWGYKTFFMLNLAEHE